MDIPIIMDKDVTVQVFKAKSEISKVQGPSSSQCHIPQENIAPTDGSKGAEMGNSSLITGVHFM
jgi:hypothetical protein